jgi:hypothetical protein
MLRGSRRRQRSHAAAEAPAHGHDARGEDEALAEGAAGDESDATRTDAASASTRRRAAQQRRTPRGGVSHGHDEARLRRRQRFHGAADGAGCNGHDEIHACGLLDEGVAVCGKPDARRYATFDRHDPQRPWPRGRTWPWTSTVENNKNHSKYNRVHQLPKGGAVVFEAATAFVLALVIFIVVLKSLL